MTKLIKIYISPYTLGVFSLLRELSIELYYKKKLVFRSYVQEQLYRNSFDIPIQVDEVKCYSFFKNGNRKKTPLSNIDIMIYFINKYNDK